MQKLAWMLLLLLACTIPWEYSLDFGAPIGNIARVVALVLGVAVVAGAVVSGRFRRPGPLQWLTLGLFLWFCCSCFWAIDRAETARHVRGNLQELMIAWLVWEVVERPCQLRALLRAYVAGAWILAVLTIGSFVLASSVNQTRFFAHGQDPNDVARYLDLAFPLAALLVGSDRRWHGRALAGSYLPLGLLSVLLTASRSGFLAALIAVAGCGILLYSGFRRAFTMVMYVAPAVFFALWAVIPRQTVSRLASIPGELTRGDLNQRMDIWAGGWQAFVRAPFLGSGAGSFVSAAGLASIDTAHNTALAVAVEGGIIALLIAATIVTISAACVLQLRGSLRIALGTVLLTLLLSSMVATVQESRATWLLLGAIAVAARLAFERPEGLSRTFPAPVQDDTSAEFCEPELQV